MLRPVYAVAFHVFPFYAYGAPTQLDLADHRQAKLTSVFLSEYTVEREKSRLSTSELYLHYARWAADNGYKPLNNRNFVGELRRRCDVRKDSHSNVLVRIALSFDTARPA